MLIIQLKTEYINNGSAFVLVPSMLNNKLVLSDFAIFITFDSLFLIKIKLLFSSRKYSRYYGIAY